MRVYGSAKVLRGACRFDAARGALLRHCAHIFDGRTSVLLCEPLRSHRLACDVMRSKTPTCAMGVLVAPYARNSRKSSKRSALVRRCKRATLQPLRSAQGFHLQRMLDSDNNEITSMIIVFKSEDMAYKLVLTTIIG